MRCIHRTQSAKRLQVSNTERARRGAHPSSFAEGFLCETARMSLPPRELLRRFGLSAPELVAETTRAIVWRVRQQNGTQAALKAALRTLPPVFRPCTGH